MQEQGRLQQPCHHIGPVNDPVEIVKFAGVVKRVKDERNQAEDVKVRALGRSPTPQQNINTDAEVYKRDELQSAKQRAIGRGENQWRFQVHTLADQRVVGFGPYPSPVELPLHAANVGYIP